MQAVVLASNNLGKLAEFAAIFARHNLQLRPQTAWQIASVAETGQTFIENALLKARHAAAITGLPALADDSGLIVPALAGRPGLHSARYAGSGNHIDKLLTELANFSGEDRQAYFYCVLVLLQTADDPAPIIAQGWWYGRILDAPRGAQGFGYDPIFYVPDYQLSAAELDPAIKNKISHRAQAVKLLNQYLTP